MQNSNQSQSIRRSSTTSVQAQSPAARPHHSHPRRSPLATGASPLSDKAITLRTLTQLKQHMYAQAARSIQSCPAKAQVIQRRVDSEARHIAFAINCLSYKL